IVTGDITLDAGAMLDLNFANGFAPSTGQTFEIISAPNLGVDDAFSQINVTGLEPGWEYSVEQSNGKMTIESLNDGVVAVPEPGFGGLMMLGAMICGGRRWLRFWSGNRRGSRKYFRSEI